MGNGKKLVPFVVSTLTGAIAAVVIVMAINASLSKVPDAPLPPASPAGRPVPGESSDAAEQDYKAITERNLFRAKLLAEIPKVKTDEEIEEEALSAAVEAMALKGVMLGAQKSDNYAVIDRGGQKGVWTYEIGEVVEKGLAITDIKKDSVKLQKGEFVATLKLFSPVAERTTGPKAAIPIAAPRQQTSKATENLSKVDTAKEIRKEGAVTVISKSLAEKLKTDNNMIMSSIAVKATTDGLKVVTVDRGSIAQKIGITPDDTLKEVNGRSLSSSQDMNKVYEALKNSTSFEVKVLRRGNLETLRYEIR